MGLTRSEKDARLAEIYARVPAIPGCDGRCWTSCGPIDMSDRERQRIRAAGIRITSYREAAADIERFWCDALTRDKRCAVYEMRPLVCRLWGAVESMRCVYGCVPEGGRWLSDAEAYRMIAESMLIGGGDAAMIPADIDAAMARADVRARLERIRERGLVGEVDRAREGIPSAFRRPPGRLEQRGHTRRAGHRTAPLWPGRLLLVQQRDDARADKPGVVHIVGVLIVVPAAAVPQDRPEQELHEGGRDVSGRDRQRQLLPVGEEKHCRVP